MPLPSPLQALRRRRDAVAQPPAPFVVGVARSGTTLLRLMLDAHPQLAIPPETHFIPKLAKALGEAGDGGVSSGKGARGGGDRDRRAIAHELITTHRRWPDFGLDPEELRRRFEAAEPFDAGAAMRAFYGLYAEGRGKPRWGDKSPSYVRRMRRVHAVLPEARFFHLIRDGRDVALSQLEVHHGADEVTQAAADWVGGIEKARRAARRLDGYEELRYEDLVDDPEPVLRRVCAAVELDYDPAMLDYHRGAEERMAETVRELRHGEREISAEMRAAQHANVSKPPQRDRAGRWRNEMTAEQLTAFEATAGPLLAELGYELE
jgi:hypothetical protein